MGDFESVFDMFFDQEEMRWIMWDMTVPKYQINKELTYL